MEKNIKLVSTCTYFDIELQKDVQENTVRWVTEKRARELMNKNVVKLLEIRKCIYESK